MKVASRLRDSLSRARFSIALGVFALIFFACAGNTPRSDGEAVLHGPGKGQGLLQVKEANGAVHIRGSLMNFTPGAYALYVGRSQSCRPTTMSDDLHGPLILFRTDSGGAARIDFITNELRTENGGRSVLGKSLVVERAFPGSNTRPVEMAACGPVQ